MSDAGRAAPPASAWSPLARPVFRAIWLATLVSNIGSWVSAVGTGWLMTVLSPSPVMVTLVQAASTLPIFLLALPAGALADIVDRRRLLLGCQVAMAAVAGLLGLVVAVGAASPALVLGATLALGCGFALGAPAFQSIVASLVPPAELRAAVALNGVGINVARAIGPALAGLLIAALGLAAPFLLNALSFLVAIVVLARWRPPPRTSHLPAERLVSAMRAGLRYGRASPPLRATVARAVGFFLFAGGYWALLPMVARDQLGGGPGSYGLLLGAIGTGAVSGAMLLARLRDRLTPDHIVLGASLGTAAVVALLAQAASLAVALPLMLAGGICWIAVLATLNGAAQTALPAWVKARGLALYMVALNGALALGSPLWGVAAARLGLAPALTLSAAGLALAAVAGLRWRLPAAEPADLAPSRHWPAPAVASDEPAPDDGPVTIQIEYRIDPARRAAFAAALARLGQVRRRDGAFAWQHVADAADPARQLEQFQVETWLEHLRQHERITMADRAVQADVHAFHVGDAPPRVTHLVAVSATPAAAP